MSQGVHEGAGFVLASDYRQEVLHHLNDTPGIPSAIADETDYPIAHVSRALGELRELGLAELLVPEERKKGRIYGITESGEDVAEFIEEMEGQS